MYNYLHWPIQVCFFTPLIHFSPYSCCFGFIAFMPLVLVKWHMTAQNSVSWRLSKGSSQKPNPETKPATASGLELNINHRFFEIFVGIETSKNSACQFWTQLVNSCQLHWIMLLNCLHSVERSLSDVVSYRSSSLPSSISFWSYNTNMREISRVLYSFMIMVVLLLYTNLLWGLEHLDFYLRPATPAEKALFISLLPLLPQLCCCAGP